jgi:hypothetical protein
LRVLGLFIAAAVVLRCRSSRRMPAVSR